MSWIFLHFDLEAFLALIGRRDAGLHVGDVDLALLADRLGQRARRHAAAEHVVGSDVGNREVGVAGTRLEHACADEGVDADDRDAGIVCLASTAAISWILSLGAIRMAFGFLAMTASRIGNLQRDVPFRRTLIDQLGADGLRRGLGALVHGDVETVSRQAGNKRNP